MPSRTRVEGQMPTIGPSRHTTSVLGNGTSSTVTTSGFYCEANGEYRITTDVVTPGFHRRIAAGEIINNPFYSKHITKTAQYTGFRVQRNPPATGTTLNVQFSDHGYGDCPSYGSVPSVNVDALKAEAGTRARAGVLEPDLEGLVELAEANKTLDLFKVRVSKVNHVLNDILRHAGRKGKLAKKGVKFLADNWLKYRYGIMPLVHSADAVLRNFGKVQPVRYTSRASASAQASSDSTSSVTGNYFKQTFESHHDVSVSVRAGVLYEIATEYPQWGFSPGDIPSAAWELLPWSFVVDWGLNAGDYIRAMTPRAGVNILASWTNVHSSHRVQTKSSSVYVGTSSYVPIISPSGAETWDSVTKTREPGVTVKLIVKEQAFPKVLNSKRALDALALMIQQLRR